MTFPDTAAQLSAGTAAVGPLAPEGASVREGDLWADTSSSPLVLRVYVDGQWQPAITTEGASSGATSPQANLMWKADATPGDPGGQRVGLDTGFPGTASTLSIASTSKSGVVIAGCLQAIGTGDVIFVWDRFDTRNWARFKATGPAEDWGNWFLVPVASAGAQGNEPADWAEVYVAFSGAG